MGIQKPFPLTAEQLYLLTLPEQRNYPVVWKKKEHINGLDTSAQSKKYGLPFIPKSLEKDILNIIAPENNDGIRLSFIFQINLKDFQDFHFTELPTSGLIQFYCSNNTLRSNDYTEEENDNFEKIMGERNQGAYQLIYIPGEKTNEENMPATFFFSILDLYTEREEAYTLKFDNDYFEVPLLHNTMYQKLEELGHHTATIRTTFEEYVKQNSKDKINEELDLLFKNKQQLFTSVIESLFHENLKTSYGNKCGGFPIYLETDNRRKNTTKFNFLLFQIDTIITQELYEEDIDVFEHKHKLGQTFQSYIMGLNVNWKDLIEWKKKPTLNMKEKMKTIFHKQYHRE